MNKRLMLRIYIVRHGQTEWSISSRHTGRTEVALTAHGEEEARGLAPLLADINFSKVLTSPRQRARMTCDLAELNSDAETETDLAEWDYGAYEALHSVDIRSDRPGWSIFRDGCPHGEMPDQVIERADRLIARLRRLEGNVALFTHGQFGSVLGARWIGLPLIAAQHFLLGTASISILGYDPHHPEISVIEEWNFVSQATTYHRPVGPEAMKRRALERWENEGGEIPKQTLK